MPSFESELRVMVDELSSPKARSRMLASFAREEIAKVKSENELAAGRTLRPPKVTVDGRVGAALGTVKPDGTIVAEFNAETEVVRWILRELELISPTLTGRYQDSHTVFADGVETVLSSAGDVPDAREFVLVSDLPYARKLDPDEGLPARSKQAPRGVYAAIAATAATRFTSVAKVRFTFRDVPLKGGSSARNPAIVVVMGGV